MFKNVSFNVIVFLSIYFVLTQAFYLYVGVISPGGKMYSALLDHYANFPAWLTYIICQGAKGLLVISGYHVYQRELDALAIVGSPGVKIIWACLGFGVMSFWIAFVVAHRAPPLYKVKWTMIGVGLITGINIIRIALIALAKHYNWKAFQSIEPHFAFNVVSYIAIFGLVFLFVYKYKKYRKKLLVGSRHEAMAT